MIPRFWSRTLVAIWGGVAIAVGWLTAGGILGLPFVPAASWSGLPLSLILSWLGMAFGLPLGIVLALARASKLPAVRGMASLCIEFIRGVPLISILFMATVMLPLFLPGASGVGKFLSVQISIVCFAAAYIAEIVRGGLHAIPYGQYAAADSLGMRYWQTMWLIVLPQALRSVIPPLVAFFIGLFQDTTLVTLVGMLDLLSTVRAAMHDPNWQGIAVVEGYILAGILYLTLSLGLGAYGRLLERRLGETKTAHAADGARVM
jgi:general L-amino acid transport system permease protein